MGRRAVLVSGFVAALLAAAASGATQRSIPLKIGDAVDVTGTKIACFAVKSNGKNGMGCVLWAKGKPLVGSYTAGLAVDGTAVLGRVKADGSSADVFKRRLQASSKVYKVKVGDMFGFQISDKVSIGCNVIDVTSTDVEPIYRGVKVSCWRATATDPLPDTYGVSISDKMAGVFRFDAKGSVTTWGVMRKQPR